MRKNIALVLALVMILSLVPMTAFAVSDNSIDYVPTVPDDYVFGVDAPVLRIEEDRAGDFAYGATQTFRLNVSNSEFLFGSTGMTIDNPSGWTTVNNDFDFSITRRTDTSVTVAATRTSDTGVPYMDIPMLVEMDGEGEARVTIDPMSSRVSGQTLTFAIGTSGETTAFVDDAEDVARGRNQPTGNIIIDETTPQALEVGKEHGFRLRLPNNFEWETSTEVRLEGMTASTTIEPTFDGRDLTVRFTLETNDDTRGSVIIEPEINVTRDANYGDVNVILTGYGDISNASNLLIAKYLDFGAAFEVEEDGEKEFFVGRLYDNNDEIYEVEFTVEETVDNSFIRGREIDFVFPSWLWVLDVETDDDAEPEGINLDRRGDNEFGYSIQNTGNQDELTFKVKFTMDGNAPIGDVADIPMTIEGAGIESMDVVIGIAKKPVVVEVAEQSEALALGTMKQPVPEVIVREVEAGALIENERFELVLRDTFGDSVKFAGFDYEIVEGNIEIDDDDYSGGRMWLDIDVASTEASTIRFYNIVVDVDRSVPQGWYQLDARGTAIVENNPELTSSSSVTGGRGRNEGYTFVTNSNLTGDWADDDYRLAQSLREADFSSRVSRTDYFAIGTDVVGEAVQERGEAVFTVGQNTYRVGDETITMDVAPFIQDGRIMVPVAHVSRALGISGSAVVWDGDARTVTIYADRVVQMAIGSSTMIVNGVGSDMGAVAMIVSDRTFVPISRFARALNVDYEWDANAQTVVFK